MSKRVPRSFWVLVGVAGAATIAGVWAYAATGVFPWVIVWVAIALEVSYSALMGFYGIRGWRQE